MTRMVIATMTAWSLLGQGAAAQPGAALPRIFVDGSLESAAAVQVVDALGTARDVAIGVRLFVADLTSGRTALDQQLAAFRERSATVWLATEAPQRPEDVSAWQAALRQLLAGHATQFGVFEVVFDGQPEAVRRFVLQVASTEIQAARPQIHVAISGRTAAAAGSLLRGLSPDVAPYVDAIVGVPGLAEDVLERARATLPAAQILERGRDAGDAATAADRIARDVLFTVGTAKLATAWSGSPLAVAGAVQSLGLVADLLTDAVTPLDPAATELAITQRGRTPAVEVRSRVLFHEQTLATYLVYEAGESRDALEVRMRVVAEGTPSLIDIGAGRSASLTEYARDAPTSTARVLLPPTGRPMVVNFSADAAVQFIDRTAVAAERRLSVDEIVARHRAYQARHDGLLRNYRASVLMQQHFRPSLTDPGYNVVTENEYFVDDAGVEWEERSFSVNGSRWGADRPPFPLLQPEKVLSLPLELRLDQDYRYALDGMERIGGVESYRVHFEPTREDATLYRGTVWIDRHTFARTRVRAVQTRTSAPVVSNEEVHTYEPVTEIDGFPLVLLTRLSARQIVLIAGRNLLLEKSATFSDFRVNDETFSQLREAARQGTRVMYRDTERGVRYLVKEGEARVVRERATASARAMAMGVLIDPSFAYPLPIFGVNYLDFEFRGRQDTQFALLFGGVLAAGNVQRPKLGGTNLDGSIDFFGIAAPASDRLYVDGKERAADALLTWPLSTGVNLGWQYTAFQKAQLQYQVRYDPFVRDRTTAESFVLPSSTVTQGIGGAWEYKKGGYSLAANGTFFARGKWKPWGPSDALEVDPARTYVKYAAHVTRDVLLDAVQKLHLNVSYFGGDRLDRFSRYQFGMFDDTRIHGVPASGVRFDQLAMVRGSYSFNIFEQYRLDLFAEQAWGQDRTVDRQWQPLTGLGFAVNLRAPWNTILRADVGKSLLPQRYRGAGSTVLQIMLLKPLSSR